MITKWQQRSTNSILKIISDNLSSGEWEKLSKPYSLLNVKMECNI